MVSAIVCVGCLAYLLEIIDRSICVSQAAREAAFLRSGYSRHV